jgi:hypothetical protein
MIVTRADRLVVERRPSAGACEHRHRAELQSLSDPSRGKFYQAFITAASSICCRLFTQGPECFSAIRIEVWLKSTNTVSSEQRKGMSFEQRLKT